MRSRLTVLVLAVTTLVVVAFTVPLFALIDREADSRARSEMETLAQSVAANLVRIVAVDGADALRASLPPLPEGIGLVFPDGSTAGTVSVAGRALANASSAQQRAVATYTASGWEVALPVLTSDGAVIVTGSVPEEELRAGVARAWLLLGMLGLSLVGASLVLADRLGRSLTGSVAELGSAARSLAAGDLATRVEVAGPTELVDVATAFNQMAPRLEALIEAEREEIADLSHQLRTPLTRLRLQIERVEDEAVRASLSEQLDDMQAAVDHVIGTARRRPDMSAIVVDDLAGFLRSRAEFWEVLAEEQGRALDVDVDVGSVGVDIPQMELTAALDALVGNVFDHTDEGVAFSLRAKLDDDLVRIVVSDRGPGFPPDIDPVARGVSGAGSSGLGLDIARRVAQRAGGSLRLAAQPGGGAAVEVVLPVVGRRRPRA